jgi:hypothetical protein
MNRVLINFVEKQFQTEELGFHWHFFAFFLLVCGMYWSPMLRADPPAWPEILD